MQLQSPTYSCWFSGTLVRDDMGHILEKAGKEVLGFASKVVITKDSTLIVTDGSNRQAVEERVATIKGQIEVQLFQSYLEFVCYIYHVCIILDPAKYFTFELAEL